MKKILIGFILLSFVLTLLPATLVLADNCTDNSNPTGSEAVCNPAPTFFVSLPSRGGFGDNTFGTLLLFFIQMLLVFVGLLAVLFIIIGGIQYVTSRGDEEQAESGKKTLQNAVIGLVIAILSYVIVVVVINALNNKT